MSDEETKLPTTAGDEETFPPPIPDDNSVSLYTTHGPIALTRNQADKITQDPQNTVVVTEYVDTVAGTSDRGAESRDHSKGRAIHLDTTRISTTIHEPPYSVAQSQTHHSKSPSAGEGSRKAPSIVQQTVSEEKTMSVKVTRHRRSRSRSPSPSPATRTNRTRRYYSPERRDDERAVMTWEEPDIGFFRRLAGQVFSIDTGVQYDSRSVNFWASGGRRRRP
jgi:hypothetical protein